ncbi:MAG: putative bifunctional diguanylate cyclase/phosphodiesterase [Mobilitalea sp.]
MKTDKMKQELSCGENTIRRTKPIHWIALILCTLLYIVFNNLLIWLKAGSGYSRIEAFGSSFDRGISSGIISQLMVMIAVILVLNPIKRSVMVAIFLSVYTALGASIAVIFEGNINALPGVVVPISAIAIVIIISRYAHSLNMQIKKVIEYNQIMKENDELLHHIAYYDSLTELPNRKMMMDQMELLTKDSSSTKKSFLLVFFDLDNFKKINDTLGHSVGDFILTQVTLRWRGWLNSEDLLGRVGGDEFALLIDRELPMDRLLEYLEGFRTVLLDAIVVEYKEFFVSASFGITRYPEDAKDTTELFRNADIALYKAKSTGKNEYRFFTKEMQNEIITRIQLENGLRASIRKNELYMVFEPQYLCGTNTLRGYEALARWRSPEIGLVSPAQFIPIAEETGIIIEMGKWIIKTVLMKFKELQRKCYITPMVSINISVVQMLEPSFVAMIKEILLETEFDSRYLEFEITESVFIACPDYIIDVIKQLRKLGIRIALDDFGTGYASLSYLQMLPINVLKIDKSFIDKISSQSIKNQIVGNIISLSHQLDIEVVAEGVELEEQLEYLTEHNCDYVQGYLLSRPINEEALEAASIEKMMMFSGKVKQLKVSGM